MKERNFPENFLEVKDVSLSYKKGASEVRAVQNVSFAIPKRGQALAIVGESGCGKTSLSRVLQRIFPSNIHSFSGEVYLEGEDILALSATEFRKRVRWKRIAWVPQNVSGALDPMQKIGSSIKETLRVHKRPATDEEVERLLKIVGLTANDAKQYPFQLSGGMQQRVLIAMALSLNPSLVILDEPTSSLDVSRQGQIIELLQDLKREFSTSFILITHNIGIAQSFCDLFAVMYAGRIVERGTTEQVIRDPLHPYTQKLLKCVPTLKSEKISFITGEPPDLTNDPGGCPFRSRPAVACDKCSDVEPILEDKGDGHYVACHGVNSNKSPR